MRRRVQKKRPCSFHFQRGGCKFSAERCRFSHEGPSPNLRSLPFSGKSLFGFIENNNPFSSQFGMRYFIYAIHNHENKSSLLSLLAHEEKFGLKKIRDIAGASIGNGTFCIRAGSAKRLISFQRVIVPLLRVLTAPAMTASLEACAYNAVLSAVIEAPNFLRNVRASMEDLLQNGSVNVREDEGMPSKKAAESTLEPKNWFDILHPLSIFLRECLDRFRSLQDDEEYFIFIENFFQWIKHCVSADKIFADKRYEKQLNNSVMPLRRRIENIRHDKEISRRIRQLKAGSAACKLDGYGDSSLVSDGPGEFSPSGKPRHDNDFADYTKIEVLPSWNEIICTDAAYLPKPGHASPHVDNNSLQVLDTQFRLIRENLTGPLRRGLRMFLQEMNLEERRNLIRAGSFLSKIRHGNETKFHVYSSVRIERVCTQARMTSTHGCVLEAVFEWPRSFKKFDPKFSGRLSPTSLVALIIQVGEENNVCFATIASRNFEKRNEPRVFLALCGPEREKTTELMFNALLEETSPDIIMLQATSVAYFNYGPVLQALKGLRDDLPFSEVLKYGDLVNSNASPPSYIEDLGGCVDLSSLIPAGFLVSEADRTRLKKAKVLSEDLNEISRLLASCTTMDLAQSNFLLSALSRKLFIGQGPPGTGKSFIGEKIAELILRNHPDAQPIEVKNNSGRASDLSCSKRPIVCITYTNHALDQFLSGLVSSGITNIIRIGRTSQDSSASVEKAYIRTREIREVQKNSEKVPKALGYYWREMIEASERIQSAVNQLTKVRNRKIDWSTLESHLSTFHPHHYQSFQQRDFTSIKDSEGFQLVLSRKSQMHFFEKWIRGGDPLKEIKRFQDKHFRAKADPKEDTVSGEAQSGSPQARPIDDLLLEDDIWDTNINERKSLVRHWKKEMNRMNDGMLKDALRRLNISQVRVKELDQELQLEVLRGAAVVGMTTTLAAKNQGLMKALGAKVIIIEEAAEILESHVLASLTEHTDHLIMIGDHKQLRPRVESYELSTDANRGFKIDMSLFERLARAKYPVETLITQRRMRPEISCLIRETVYLHLADHESTQRFPSVKGVCHNTYFIDHRFPEDAELQGRSAAHLAQLEQKKSHANKFEAAYAVNLARYLVQQGYDNEKIAILTPYVGQLLLLRDALEKSFVVKYSEKDLELLKETGLIDENVDTNPAEPLELPKSETYTVRSSVRSMIRISSIDNFQGEEADVVIICLVRSNSEGNIGFVKSPNRANVLLSRAREGMYIIGNSAVFRQSPMWAHVIQLMHDQNKIGASLELRCAQHSENKTTIRSVEDFSRVRDGGCSRNCAYRMSCGHTCPRRCHPDDPQHKGAYCNKPCTRLRSSEECPYRHPCNKVCGDECGRCREVVTDIKLPCGHVKASAECWEVSTGLKNLSCDVKIPLNIQGCGHRVQLRCSSLQKKDSKPLERICPATCDEPLECGHNCSKKCGSCWTRGAQKDEKAQGEEYSLQKYHGKCIQKCERRHICGHFCDMPCHTPEKCTPCKRKCEEFCEHSKCGRTCEVSCMACIEPCTWCCEHQGRCLLPCGAPCDRDPCDRRCTRNLPCGHQCPSVCGELCPPVKWCYFCSGESNKNQQVDLVLLRDYKDVDCETDPIIVLECNHAFTVSFLDGLEKASMQDPVQTGSTLSGENSVDFVCPNCRTPIRRIKRYGGAYKTKLLNLNSAKHDMSLRVRTESLEKVWECKLLENIRNQMEATDSELNKSVALLQRILENYEEVSRLLSQNPRIRLYAAAYSHLRRVEDSVDDKFAICSAEEYKKRLLAVRPDFTHQIRVLQGKGRVFQHLGIIRIMQHVRQMERKTADRDALTITEEHKHVLSLVEQSEEDGNGVFEKSVRFFDEAEETALSGKNTIRARFAKCHKIENWLLRIKSIFLLAAKYKRLDSSLREIQLRLYDRLEKEVKEALESISRKDDGWNSEILQGSIQTLKNLGEDGLQLLKRRIEARVFYTEVSAEEREKIISAALTAGLGAWNSLTRGRNMYQCSNHHVYFIGECGGAMETGACPECGERIGGANHVLQPSNARANF